MSYSVGITSSSGLNPLVGLTKYLNWNVSFKFFTWRLPHLCRQWRMDGFCHSTCYLHVLFYLLTHLWSHSSCAGESTAGGHHNHSSVSQLTLLLNHFKVMPLLCGNKVNIFGSLVHKSVLQSKQNLEERHATIITLICIVPSSWNSNLFYKLALITWIEKQFA